MKRIGHLAPTALKILQQKLSDEPGDRQKALTNPTKRGRVAGVESGDLPANRTSAGPSLPASARVAVPTNTTGGRPIKISKNIMRSFPPPEGGLGSNNSSIRGGAIAQRAFSRQNTRRSPETKSASTSNSTYPKDPVDLMALPSNNKSGDTVGSDGSSQVKLPNEMPLEIASNLDQAKNVGSPQGAQPSVSSSNRSRDNSITTASSTEKSVSDNKAPQNHLGLLDLPVEILLATTKHLSGKDIKEVRLTNEQLNQIGIDSIKNLVVHNPEDLQKALSVYGPGGIQSLTLKGNFTDADLENLPASLAHLNVSGCYQLTDAALQKLPASLAHLNVSECYQLTDAALQKLPASLVHLDVGWCNALTDAALQKLPASVVHLDVRQCDTLTDAALQKLPPSLAHLNVSGCVRMTDAALQKLPASLAHLNVSECVRMTDAALQKLPASLVHLDVSRCGTLTHAALQELPASLAHLNVSGCVRMTDAALQKLPASLAHFNVWGCRQLTNAALQSLPAHVTIVR